MVGREDTRECPVWLFSLYTAAGVQTSRGDGSLKPQPLAASGVCSLMLTSDNLRPGRQVPHDRGTAPPYFRRGAHQCTIGGRWVVLARSVVPVQTPIAGGSSQELRTEGPSYRPLGRYARGSLTRGGLGPCWTKLTLRKHLTSDTTITPGSSHMPTLVGVCLVWSV